MSKWWGSEEVKNMTELGELEKSLNMQVKATPENTAMLCEIHIEDARELLLEAIKENKPIDIDDASIIEMFLKEALDFIRACQSLMSEKR